MALGVLAVARIPKASAPAARDHENPLTAIVSGLAFAFTSPVIGPTVLLTLAIGVFFAGTYVVLLPLMVRDIYSGGSAEISIAFVTFMLGTLVMTMVLNRIGGVSRWGRALCLGLFGGATSLTPLAFAPPEWVFYLSVFGWGLGAGVTMSMSRTIVQAATTESHRARTMSIYSLGMMGGMPVGSLLMGYVIEQVGPTLAVWLPVIGVTSVVALVACAAQSGRSRKRSPSPQPDAAANVRYNERPDPHRDEHADVSYRASGAGACRRHGRGPHRRRRHAAAPSGLDTTAGPGIHGTDGHAAIRRAHPLHDRQHVGRAGRTADPIELSSRPAREAVYDLVVDGVLTGSRSSNHGNTLKVDLRRPGRPELEPGDASALRWDGLPAGSKLCELWLPVNAMTALRYVGLDDGASLSSAPDDERPLWGASRQFDQPLFGGAEPDTHLAGCRGQAGRHAPAQPRLRRQLSSGPIRREDDPRPSRGPHQHQGRHQYREHGQPARAHVCTGAARVPRHHSRTQARHAHLLVSPIFCPSAETRQGRRCRTKPENSLRSTATTTFAPDA